MKVKNLLGAPCAWGFATLLLLVPLTAATVAAVPYLGTVLNVAVLYLALGHRSLHDHARPSWRPSLRAMRPRHAAW